MEHTTTTDFAELVTMGQALAERRTWVRRAYDELLDAANAQLKTIPVSNEPEMRYLIREWMESPDPRTHRVYAELTFSEETSIRLGYYQVVFDERRNCTLYQPSITTIRAFGDHFAAMIEHFASKFQECTTQMEEASAVLASLLNAVTERR